jgi:hypothetical protein
MVVGPGVNVTRVAGRGLCLALAGLAAVLAGIEGRERSLFPPL